MRTLFGIILALFCTATFLEAKDMNALSTNERNLAAIAANTARGDMANLKTALNKGLDEGLSINEIKEVLTQLYAYCGFPRSLNARASTSELQIRQNSADAKSKELCSTSLQRSTSI